MTPIKIGYARVSTAEQDLTARRNGLVAPGIDERHIYVDYGPTGTNRVRPGLREALAAVRSGDSLVVTKLDRLARSLPDARDIADELTRKGIAPSLGGSVYDPNDPVGRLLFTVPGMVAEFEADLVLARTREGMAVARAKGRLRGKRSKLSVSRRRHLAVLLASGGHPQAELAEPFSVSRTTIYREAQRATRSRSRDRDRCVDRLRPPPFCAACYRVPSSGLSRLGRA